MKRTFLMLYIAGALFVLAGVALYINSSIGGLLIMGFGFVFLLMSFLNWLED